MARRRSSRSSLASPPSATPLLAAAALLAVAAAATATTAAGFAALPPPAAPSRRPTRARRFDAAAARPPGTSLSSSGAGGGVGGPSDAPEGEKGEAVAAAPERAAAVTNGDDENHHRRVGHDGDGHLSAQDRVLLSLGLEPESAADRSARVASRLAAEESLRRKKRTNAAVAVLAFAAALLNYVWRLSHPVTAVEILAEMQSRSDPLAVVGRNGRPTVVDFWAPWCENCKASAPTLQSIEKEYADRVNFVMVNGDDGNMWPVIERFGVDAIPHMAMVSREGYVETALIGPIPRSVLRADLDAMLEEGASPRSDGGEVREAAQEESREEERKPLPYVMYDAFRNRPEQRRIRF